MLEPVRSLWTARNLLINLVRRDLTVRYKSTVLGFFWSFAKPLAYMGIYYVVFGLILGLTLDQPEIHYALHVLTGVLPWMFFTGATGAAMNSILASANVVKKVKLPLEVFPVAAVLSEGVHFGLSMVVVVVVMIFFRLIPGPLFLIVPMLILIQLVLVLSVALLLAALNVYYRDVVSIWEVISAGWFYFTPILYPAGRATGYFADRGWDWAVWLYLANPLAPITIAYRRLMLYGAVDVPPGSTDYLKTEIPDSQLLVFIGVATLSSFVFLWFSHWVFAKLSPRFADKV